MSFANAKTKNQKKALVTGASGFLGANLVKKLLDEDYEVYAVSRKQPVDIEHPLLHRITCDVANSTEFEKRLPGEGLKECLFFHLAWTDTSGPGRADYATQLSNVKTTCDLVKFAARSSCKRFIYASSINEMETYEYLQSDDVEPGGGYIYGTAKLPAHLMGEVVAYQEGIEFIPVIITNIYGAGEKSARMINTAVRKLLNGEHCSFTAGNQMYDFVYLTDAINSIYEVATKGKPFTRYYIGSGNPKPLKEFLFQMRDAVAPDAELGLGDIPFRGKSIDYSQFDLQKVENDTGYKNAVTFEEGIRLTAQAVRAE